LYQQILSLRIKVEDIDAVLLLVSEASESLGVLRIFISGSGLEKKKISAPREKPFVG
jgi:hypothetical protein